MSTKTKKWPGISVTDTDHEIIQRIRTASGVLRYAQQKDIILVAASIGAQKKLPKSAIEKKESRSREIMHISNMNKPESSEYRQYIALIFYMTEGHKDLSNMADTSAMVGNFIDYAQRGLRALEADYLDKGDGSDALLDEMAELLAKH
jgi:hypothetical protein